MKTRFLVLVAFACAACITLSPDPPGSPEAVSLVGERLARPVMKPEDARRREEDLEQAKKAFDANPHDADAVVWYGRRLAYVGRFRDAITVYAMGIAEHPDDARLFRHRGHRWITLRQFDRAIADLEIAARLLEGKPDEPEPAGTPNARGVPVDTLKHNVYYHLALAHYLRGEFEASLPVWEECAKWSTSPDTLCSVTHWRYMTLRRLGRHEEAQKTLEPIRKDLDVVEYHAYHRLCLAYRGEVSFDDLWEEIRKGDRDGSDFPTIGYGIANWHLYNDRPALGMGIMRQVAQAPLWPAFGRIAAEAEVAGSHEPD